MRRVILVTLLAALTVLAGCQVPGMGSPGGDPATDQLGWENGYWYDSELSVTPENGLNDSELNATVSRAMARVERVRGLEFEETIPVKVINRSTYRNETGGNNSEALRQFDNAKFEALFLVGEEEDSIENQEENRGSTVAGYYSPGEDAIVIVSNSENPTLSNERTLAHELVHGLQDQHFGLSNSSAKTRDAYAGRTGLVEGDASYTEEQYMQNCGEAWSCLNATTGGGAGGASDIHFGLYMLQYFPYSEGPIFIDAIHERGGWDAVDDAYANVPDSATEVLNPDRFPGWEPTNVTLGTADGAWERISPPNRPNYGVLGQSAITASFGYTVLDQPDDGRWVVEPTSVLNYRQTGGLDPQRPFNYSIAPVEGWTGGKFVAFEGETGELAYAWRTQWNSTADANQFATGWGDLIQYWGGQQVAEDTYVIEDGEFADAFRITVDGSTVTVVNAPERSDLGDFDGV